MNKRRSLYKKLSRFNISVECAERNGLMLEKYRFIILLLTYSIIGLVVSTLYTSIYKTNVKEVLINLKNEHVTIHLPKLYKWVGLVGSIFFATFLLFPNDTAVLWVVIGFWIFILLGLYIFVSSLIWKINIFKERDYFLYTNSFGIKYEIHYSNILFYKDGYNTLRIKTNKKMCFIDNKATNIEFLFAMLKKHKVKEVLQKK